MLFWVYCDASIYNNIYSGFFRVCGFSVSSKLFSWDPLAFPQFFKNVICLECIEHHKKYVPDVMLSFMTLFTEEI